MLSPRRPRVLMVTGAYFPELSGGGLQARGIVRALAGQAEFAVLTTSTNPALPANAVEEGVSIRRIYVDTKQRVSAWMAAGRIGRAFLTLAPRFDIVNLHGFSRKAILLRLLSRMLGKRFVLTLQTGGHDEPAAADALGFAASWAFRHADLYLSVSPGLSRAYLDAGLPAKRLRQVCNAVDVERFAPASPAERAALRAELNLPVDVPVILFVGYFSRDKRPDLLYRAWSRIAHRRPSMVVFIGATLPTYQEVDAGLADAIRSRAVADGLADRLVFVEATPTIERYVRASDIYVLTSIREGLPIALIEAMASGLACVASRLPGATDALIEHDVSGLLVTPDAEAEFAGAIGQLLDDRATAERLCQAARRAAVDRFAIQNTAAAWLHAYQEVSETR
jgi:glycosyltransferase involved in cell wall biosynthesis